MLFSIIIPVYNVESYLEECLYSIQGLDSSKFEIIIINDGSTDKSSEIINKWTAKNNAVVINQKNSGLSHARNVGINRSTGKYIAFIDSDDYVDAELLEKMFEIANKQRVDICTGDFIQFSDKNNTENITFSIDCEENRIYSGVDFLSNNHRKLMSVVWRSIYRKSFIVKNNIIFHEGIYFEDVEFTPLCFQAATRVVYKKIPFYKYRKRINSITSSETSLKKIIDSLSIWNTLKSDVEYNILKEIFEIMGFHCFLKQYSQYKSLIGKDLYIAARELSKSNNLNFKYKAAGLLMRILPEHIYKELLRYTPFK